MTNERFLGENVSPRNEPSRYERLTMDLCCLCDEPIGVGPWVDQVFEADPEGLRYTAHASCARGYAMALRAFRAASGGCAP